MPLPSAPLFRPLPQFQQDRLRRWLTERATDLSLPEVECPPPLAPQDCPQIDPNYDTKIEIGDIRILSWEALPGSLALVWVAVLATSGGRQWLIAPYSRYADAATPNEFEIAPEGPADTRVLCLWNARTIPHADLSKGWRAGELSAEQLNDALAVWRDQSSDEPLPESLQQRVGPIISMQSDPRHQYLREGSLLLAPLTAASLREAERAEMPLAAVVCSQVRAAAKGLRTLASAAGAAAMDYAAGIKADIEETLSGFVFQFTPLHQGGMRAEGSEGSVRILELSAGDTGVKLELSEQVDSPGSYIAEVQNDSNQILTGGRLLAPDGSELARFHNNISGLFKLDAGILLELRDGSLVPLTLLESK